MQKQRLHDVLLLAAAPVVLTGLLESFSRAQPGLGIRTLLSLVLTLLLWLGACLLLSWLRSFRLRWICTCALGLAASLIGLANRYKMRYRIEPVLLTDVYQLGDAVQTVQHLEFAINFAELALLLAAFMALFFLSFTLVRFQRPKHRVLLPCLGLVLLLGVPPFCTFESMRGTTRYDLVDVAQTDGVIYTALAVDNQRRSLMRVDYEEADVRAQYRALMEETPSAAPSAASDGPNIILVLSESFTDEQWLADYLHFTREITPFYNQLIQTCRSGRIYVPKAGGGTSETEFEVLTGLRSKYALNPYAMGLPPMNSLASVLRDKGYASSAIHWQTGVYYNRYNNLRRLGFTSFFTTDTTEAPFTKKGQYVCDNAHYQAALSQMKRTKERDFVFVITMQNHGGYAYDDFRVTYGADTPFDNALDAETEKIAANFCWMLEESDRALETFVTELQAFEEPTLLVLFGDHIAPFGEEAYADLGADLTGEDAHLTPYFIWSNQENEPVREDLYAWQLGAQALETAGLGDDAFLHYVASLQTPEDELHSLLSYDALFGRQYTYSEVGISPESKVMHIGGEMQLLGFETALIGDAVYLRPRLQMPQQKHRLSINGKFHDDGWVSASAGEMKLSTVMTGLRGAVWNQSNTLQYASAQELLAQSEPWPCEVTTLTASDWTMVQSPWYRACTVWKSQTPCSPHAASALLYEGVRLEYQPSQSFKRPGRYTIDTEGYLWLSVRRGETPEEVQLYLLQE